MKCSKCGTEMPDGVKFCSECGSKTNDVVQEHNNEKDSLNHIISELKGSFLNSKKTEENNEQGSDDNKEPSAESSINDIYKNISQKAAHVYNDLKEQYDKQNNSVEISKKKNDSNSVWKGLALITIFVMLILYINRPKNSEDIKEKNQGTAISKNSAIEKVESSDTKKNSKNIKDYVNKTKDKAEKNSKVSKMKSNAVNYSTNTKDTVDNGNKGVYSYIAYGDSYNQYYIIDLDKGYVYYFNDDNDDCERLKIDSGNLNKGITVTYHDGNDKWSNKLHFSEKNESEVLIMEDNYGFETEFYSTNLKKALKLKNA